MPHANSYSYPRNRFAKVGHVFSLIVAFFFIAGCSADSQSASPQPNPSSSSTNNHLVTPPSTDDLTKLTESHLSRRLELARIQLDKDMNIALSYATQYTGNDLQRDAGYRGQLQKMKKAETELSRLEDDLIRRKELNDK